MKFSLPSDPHQLGIGGKMPAPGRYHVVVLDVDASFQKTPKNIPVHLEVLAGTVPGQAGMTTTEFLYYDRHDIKDFAVERLGRFLWACGLIRPGEEADVQPEAAVGRQLVVELFEDSYEKNGVAKKSMKISWIGGGVWPLGDPEVSDVPISREALATLAPTTTSNGPRVSAPTEPFAELASVTDDPNDPYAGL